MRRLKMLLLLILIDSCVAQNSCALGTKPKCKDKGKKIGVEPSCQPKNEACDGKLLTGNKFCEDSENCGCCVPECGEPQPACVNAGGECHSRDDDCDGKWLIGKKYCLKTRTCGCCAPIDCPKDTLWPCSALNGTCIGHDDVCDGHEVTTKGFCKYPDTCKCCIQEEFTPNKPCDPVECHHWGVAGRCFHDDIPGWSYVGKEQCTGSCACWVSPRPKGPCDPLECQYNGTSGRCSRDDALLQFLGWSNVGGEYCGHGCKCWLPPPPNVCVSKHDQCTGPNDYCLEKMSCDCPDGFEKVLNACSKRSLANQLASENTLNTSPLNITSSTDCDCCKSIEVTEIPANSVQTSSGLDGK